jgi:hypothetical protein
MKTNLTYRQLDDMAARAAGIRSVEILPEMRQQYVTVALMDLWKKLQADPFYQSSVTLSVSSDTELLATGPGVVPGTTVIYAGPYLITAFSETSITRSSGTFQTGAILAVTFMRAAGLTVGVGHLLFRVVKGGATAEIELIAPTGFADTYNPLSDAVIVQVMRSQALQSASLSAFYFDRVISVKDSVTRPGQGTFDFVPDADGFNALPLRPSMVSRVAYRQAGDTLYFFLGSSAPALGVVTAEIRTKPNPYSNDTQNDQILLPPEYAVELIGQVSAMYSRHGQGQAQPLTRAEQ